MNIFAVKRASRLNGFFSIVTLVCFLVLSGRALAQWDAPPSYYAGATGTGAQLKSQLTTIMSTGHIQRSYGDFRDSAAIHDQDPTNPSRILLVYNVASVNATWDSGATWNREHVWPESRQPGTTSNSSKGNLGDPHALRPCNPSINTSRQNKPFGFDATTGAHGSVGSYYFPGDHDKGDIARTLFYSDTRWASLGLSLTDNAPTGFQMGDLSSLIAWHYLDPPDEFERRRNHTIYSNVYNPSFYTNNRNAFVDRPEYVWSIYVDQQNDSMITIDGGQLLADGESTLDLDFGYVIVGSNYFASQSVTVNKSGQDGTYYSVQAFDDATSNVNGFYNAFRTNGTDDRTFTVGLEFDPDLPGVTNGVVVVDNLDVTTQGGSGRGANDENDTINLSITVLDHANASFSDSADENVLLVDLGSVALGSGTQQHNFSIYNLPSGFGESLTAHLDLDAIDETDADNKFNVVGPLFTDLVAGTGQSFTVTGETDTAGTFTAMYEFSLSDENVPGAANQTIAIMVSMDVTGLLGDMNGDGLFNNADIAAFVQALINPSAYASTYPNLDPNVIGDFNNDGNFSNADIPGFVSALLGS
jgi:endonuclease I